MDVVERSKSVKFGPVVGFLKKNASYSIILLISRLVLAFCYYVVSLDTWNRFRKLSRLPEEGNYDLSLDTLPNFTGDLSWVPPAAGGGSLPENYGANRLFGLYLVRLSHYFHRRISLYLVYFSSTILLVLILISCFDLVVMFAKRFRLKKYKNFALFLRFVFYSLLFALVFSQFMFLMYYKRSLCSLENLHPSLFTDNTDPGVRLELLKNGTCKHSERFFSTYVLGFLTLVPDCFLILIAIMPVFRVHSLLNGMKYFGCIFFFVTAFVILDAKYYVSVGQNPRVLDFGVTKFNETAMQQGRLADVVKLLNTEKAMKMFRMKDMISYRVNYALMRVVTDPLSVPEPRFQLPQAMLDKQGKLAHFNFGRQLYALSVNKFEFYYYFCFYAGMVTLFDAVAGTILMVKRHRFLLPIVGIVNFFYFFTHLLHCIMVQYPIHVCGYFCKITQYAVDPTKLSFELLSIADLVCKIREVYRSCFAFSIFLVVLATLNVANLYFIHKFH